MGTGAEYAQMRRHRPTMYVDNYHRIFAFSQSDQVQIWYEWIILRYRISSIQIIHLSGILKITLIRINQLSEVLKIAVTRTTHLSSWRRNWKKKWFW